MINEYSKIGVLKGIGEKTEQIFGKVGIATVGDLIRYYPHRYEVYEDPVPIGEDVYKRQSWDSAHRRLRD